jgi:tetratricopeptide (TPR) repeat protein
MRHRYLTIAVGFLFSLLLTACSSHEKTVHPEDLTASAWAALKEKPEEAIEKAQACIALFEQEAIEQQGAIVSPPPLGRVTDAQKTAISANWALNNVGTCYYILGKAFAKLGRTTDAREAYEKAQEYFYARAWDSNWNGFYWSPAVGASNDLVYLR